jgi:hypothetical protein
MHWKRRFDNVKLAVALALIVVLCLDARPHVEQTTYHVTPNTTATISVSGSNVNTSAGSYTSPDHPWNTKFWKMP